MSETKPREFWNVSLLRDAKDSSKENYLQLTFNPRLHLIEHSAYASLEAKVKELESKLDAWKNQAETLASLLHDTKDASDNPVTRSFCERVLQVSANLKRRERQNE